jgi:hypothetical protein
MIYIQRNFNNQIKLKLEKQNIWKTRRVQKFESLNLIQN